jgi:hypothetical protein
MFRSHANFEGIVVDVTIVSHLGRGRPYEWTRGQSFPSPRTKNAEHAVSRVDTDITSYRSSYRRGLRTEGIVVTLAGSELCFPVVADGELPRSAGSAWLHEPLVLVDSPLGLTGRRTGTPGADDQTAEESSSKRASTPPSHRVSVNLCQNHLQPRHCI